MSSFRAWLGACGPAAITAGVALAAVAAVTGFISYTHICALTLELHQSWKTAHLMPFAVDGQIVVGSVVLLAGRGRAAWWGWLGIAPGLAESLFANWESGIVHGHLAAVWATVPAQAFAVASFMFERWLKSQVGQGGRNGRNGRNGQTEAVSNTVPISETHADLCSHFTALSVDDAAVQAFLHARECLGEPLSQRQLSDQFGLTRHKVAELVAPYLPAEPETIRYASSGAGAEAVSTH